MSQDLHSDPFSDLDDAPQGEDGDKPEAKPNEEQKSPTPTEEPQKQATSEVDYLIAKDKVAELINKNVLYKEHAGTILDEAKKPENKNRPIEQIVAIALGADELIKIGSRAARNADQELNDDFFNGSNPSRETVQPKDAWEMTKEEFAAETERIKRKAAGRY